MQKLSFNEVMELRRNQIAQEQAASASLDIGAAIQAAFRVPASLWYTVSDERRADMARELAETIQSFYGFSPSPNAPVSEFGANHEKTDAEASDGQNHTDASDASDETDGIAEMTKAELKIFAEQNFSADLDLTQKKETLVAQVRELIAASQKSE